MKLRKQERRERALKRFTIQTDQQWNNGIKGSKSVGGSYQDYLDRKAVERASLESIPVAYSQHIIKDL